MKEALASLWRWLFKNAKKIFSGHKASIYAEIDGIIDEEFDKLEQTLLDYTDEVIKDEFIRGVLKEQIDKEWENAKKETKESYKAFLEKYLEE